MIGPIFRKGAKDVIVGNWNYTRREPRLATRRELGRCERCGSPRRPLHHSAYVPWSVSVLDESAPLWCEACIEGEAERRGQG